MVEDTECLPDRIVRDEEVVAGCVGRDHIEMLRCVPLRTDRDGCHGATVIGARVPVEGEPLGELRPVERGREEEGSARARLRHEREIFADVERGEVLVVVVIDRRSRPVYRRLHEDKLPLERIPDDIPSEVVGLV